jgi:hypothetical protein
MPRKRTATDWDSSILESSRRRKTVPEGLLRRRMAVVKRDLTARLQQESARERQAEKYWSQIQKPGRPVDDDPRVARSIDGLLAMHRTRAKRKLAAPRLPGGLGGILGGSFSAKVTPPYDYAYSVSFPRSGRPILTGSANRNTGQLSGSAVTDQAACFGSVYNEMGIYLHPMFGPAILRLSASPAFSIEWWTNSLYADSTVLSFGEGRLGIYATQGIIGPSRGARAVFDSWDQEATQQILLDYGSNPHIPVSVELEVDPSFTCMLFIATVNRVSGVGWPGSLAGSMMSVTLPSLSFELELIPVASQG